MISLGNIALSLKDRVLALKSDYIVISHFLPPFLLAQRVLASCPVVDSAVILFISDVGVKTLANSLTQEGPMRL